ncbi:hypothetical protein [Methylosoma difficile]
MGINKSAAYPAFFGAWLSTVSVDKAVDCDLEKQVGSRLCLEWLKITLKEIKVIFICHLYINNLQSAIGLAFNEMG